MRFPAPLAACAVLIACSLDGVLAAVVSDVTVRAVSPWTNLVEIAYSLDAGLVPEQENGRLVQTVTVRDTRKGTSLVLTNNLVEASLFPRTPSFAAGRHRLVWKPLDSGISDLSRVSVEVAVVETTNPQKYCVVDLSGGTAATRHPVTYVDDVPAGGWTDAYKTDFLVLRLIEPGTFTMGDQVHGGPVYPDITLTQPYYIGVFETTAGQWARMEGGGMPAAPLLPVSGVSFSRLRGGNVGRLWPERTDIDAWPSVALNGLRQRSGLQFDLPTEAQWEYAARAGTATDYGNGTSWSGTGFEDAAMSAVGRYTANDSAVAPVGRYAPNGWGIYDMHGNVQELCLDRWADAIASPAVDPVGSATEDLGSRVARGGYWDSRASDCTSSSREKVGIAVANDKTGFRLVCPAPVASETLRGSGCSPETALALDARDPMPVGGDPLPVDFDPLYAGVDPADGACTVRVTLDGAETLVETNGFGRLEGWTAHWYTNVLRHVVLKDGVEVGEPLERRLLSTLGPEALSLGECVNAPHLAFTTGGTGGWSRDTVTNMDGVVSLRSRNTGDNGCSWLETTVVGEGTLSFWWKVEGEHLLDKRGNVVDLYDYVSLEVDGRPEKELGVGEWTLVTLEISGEGTHVLRWSYQKDDSDVEGDARADCAWLDLVSWSGAVPGPEHDETETTPVPVKYAWLDRYPSVLAAAGGDYEAAANAPTGKRDAAGNSMYVWQDYVAGTDPTRADDILRAFIRVVDGQPFVTRSPDLGDARCYRLWGATAPTGPWEEREWDMPDPADRFFKVSVSMPE